MSHRRRIAAMPNVHSHAFQRDLRGVAERSTSPRDDFWSWRSAMFAAVDRLDPPAMRAVGERVYAEMKAAGYGAVGEFHYVHHRSDGSAYEDPNAMAVALAEAAAAVGLEIVLLPAAYHRGGYGRPAVSGQRRFCDPSVGAFLERVEALAGWAEGRPGVSVGIAAHSVRAVPSDWLGEIAAFAEAQGMVRHVHAHEQPRELEECRAEHGCTPIELLSRSGFLGARTTIVHGIHVEPSDVGLLAESETIVASCPTTEGSLGDGWFPALEYRDAGVRIAIGSDSNVIVDPFEEVRELESAARRTRRTRYALLAASDDLWSEVARNGLASLGLDAGAEVEIDTSHPRLAGIEEADLMRAVATCAAAEVVVGRGDHV